MNGNRMAELEQVYYTFLESTRDAIVALINKMRSAWGRDTWRDLLVHSANGDWDAMRSIVSDKRKSKTRDTMLSLLDDAERYTAALSIF